MELKKTLLVALATTLALGSCTDFTNGFDEKAHYYQENFVKQFGEIDPNQDWNMATRANVTVNVSNESNVQIFALNGGTYKLVGDYSKVNGSQTLGVDVLKGTEKLLVTDGFSSLITSVGGNVSFGLGTRTIHTGVYDPEEEAYDTNGNALTVTIAKDKTKIFTRDEVLKWDAVLPEIAAPSVEAKSDGLRSMEETGLCNLDKATRDFRCVSTGTFYVYPIYYITSQQNTVGIYIKEGGSIKKAPLYTIGASNGCSLEEDEMILGTYEWKYCDYGDPRNAKGLEETEEFKPAVWEGDEMKQTAQYLDLVWSHQPGSALTGFFSETADKNGKYVTAFDVLKVTPIKVEVPVGAVFGFYLENSNTCYYSQSSENSDYDYVLKYKPDGKTVDPTTTTLSTTNHACHVATFNLDGLTYVGFEDWTNEYGNSDMDLNDLMLVIEGASPSVIDEDPTSASWVLACEDLGGSFDGDYNDVVFSVEHVSGRPYATVTPLAAGGTLASYLYFDDTQLGEIHSLLGGSTATSGDYTPINVGPSRGSAGHQIRVTVPTNFSMAYCETGSAEFDAINANNMGGFYVKVAPKGSTGDTELGENSVIAAPEMGAVPAIFCIPATYTVDNDPATGKQTEYYWAWAQELNSLISINNDQYGSGAYPDFAGWVADHTQNTEWYKNPSANGKIVSERKTVRDMVTSGGDDSYNTNISCTFSSVESCTTSWGASATGQTINIPSGAVVGDKLKVVTENNKNRDFNLGSYKGSKIVGGSAKEFEITLTEEYISVGIICVVFYEENSVVSAEIIKQ